MCCDVAPGHAQHRRHASALASETPLRRAERSSADVLLTHRDHAAHGSRYADRFGARLWIHEGDLDAAPDADRVLRGTDPAEIADGVVAFPLPGHTRGSVVYLADERYCFSGDSFYWSRTTSDIEVTDTVTWYSIKELAASWPGPPTGCALRGCCRATATASASPATTWPGGCNG